MSFFYIAYFKPCPAWYLRLYVCIQDCVWLCLCPGGVGVISAGVSRSDWDMSPQGSIWVWSKTNLFCWWTKSMLMSSLQPSASGHPRYRVNNICNTVCEGHDALYLCYWRRYFTMSSSTKHIFLKALQYKHHGSFCNHNEWRLAIMYLYLCSLSAYFTHFQTFSMDEK